MQRDECTCQSSCPGEAEGGRDRESGMEGGERKGREEEMDEGREEGTVAEGGRRRGGEKRERVVQKPQGDGERGTVGWREGEKGNIGTEGERQREGGSRWVAVQRENGTTTDGTSNAALPDKA